MMKGRVAVCPNCGEEARTVRGMWKFDESGLKNVRLAGIEIIECKHCGEQAPIIPRINQLMIVLARAVISKPYGLIGNEVRFLRKHMEMTQEGFSRLVRVDKTTVSKWENGEHPVGGQSDQLIRFLVMVHDDELRPQLEQALEKFKETRAKSRSVPINIDPKTLEYQYA